MNLPKDRYGYLRLLFQAAHLISEFVLGRTNPDAELFDPARLVKR